MKHLPPINVLNSASYVAVDLVCHCWFSLSSKTIISKPKGHRFVCSLMSNNSNKDDIIIYLSFSETNLAHSLTLLTVSSSKTESLEWRERVDHHLAHHWYLRNQKAA